MKNLQFEKVNMKIVVIVGVTIIAILTAMFIIFRTNLIIDRDKEKEPNTSENGNGNGNGNNGGENGDEPNVDPEDPNGGNGNGGSSGNGNGNGNGNNGGDNGDEPEEPNYDDPDEDPVSKEAKDRTKDKEDLTIVEKEYIIQENISKDLGKEKEIQNNCIDNTFCKVDVTKYNQYTSKKDKIGDCAGDVIFTYDKKKKELVFDMSEVKCEE